MLRVSHCRHGLASTPTALVFRGRVWRRWLGSDSAGVMPQEIERMSRFKQTPLSLSRLIEFGESGRSPSNALKSALFLRSELPVRLAHMLQDFDSIPSLLTQTAPARRVRNWYIESFEDLMRVDEEKMKRDDPATVVADFTAVLRGVLLRHQPVVTTMAQGILELRQKAPSQAAFYAHYDFHEFLDRFYTARIGIRLLMQQHIQLFGDGEETAPHGWVGAIDPNCRPAEVAEDAAENARFLCEQRYGISPKFEVVLPNSKGRIITFSYIPSFLYHIVFELVKNSMRAVVETHGDAPSLPPVKIVVVEGEEDCTIKISDEGGGIKRSGLPLIFSYLYTTAPMPKTLDVGGSGGADMNNAPLAGFGFGLPMSRLYARYLGGDLSIVSVEGFGTDALVQLKRAKKDALEMLPQVKPYGAIAKM